MASSGQLTSSALRALLQDGKLVGSWVLDASRSEVRLMGTSMHNTITVHAVFTRQ